MRELSLFSGAGGGLLGSKLLGWKTVGYVEINDYFQRIIAQRITDGILDNAPIFGNIEAFIDSGYSAAYTELVDIITAGFPCQPFSLAGKRKGEQDQRNQWPNIIKCIRIIRPKFCFLENVPGLLSSGYFGQILADLAEIGYDCRWRCLSAAELGAPHIRNRLWILAYANGIGCGSRYESAGWETGADFDRCRERANVVDTNSKSQPESSRESAWNAGWWDIEPGMGRMVDGMAFRVDRLKAIGNGQVPAVVAKVWKLLTGNLI